MPALKCKGSSVCQKSITERNANRIQWPTRGAAMTVTESKDLKKGNRVYWQGDGDDSGTITETSWDSVTISWNTGKVASVHHGECAKFSERLQRRTRCKEI